MDLLAWPINALPQIVVAGRFSLADRSHETRYGGAAHALHLHDYAAEMRLDGETRRLARGDLTLSPAGLPSSYALPTPGLHWCVRFAPAVGVETVPLPLHLPAGDAAGALREGMAHVAALHARSRDSRAAEAAASLSLQLLLLRIAEGKNGAPSVAERAAAVIDARFADPLDVPTIAAAVGRSPAHLARAFRARYGTTLAHRLIARRMEHARYLLEATDLPLWRIAERVGIPDPQHFNKSIRRLLGESPSAIRARSCVERVDPDR